MKVNVGIVDATQVKLLETVIFAGLNARAQQENQNLTRTLLITNHICVRGKF